MKNRPPKEHGAVYFIQTSPKTVAETGQAIIDILRRLPGPARQTLTFDNGGEFQDFPRLEAALDMATYFCDPHAPWQRGTIENTNGLLRRDMPRKTDITNYTARDIGEIAWTVNSTPRKCLGYKTPAEAFLENIRCCG